MHREDLALHETLEIHEIINFKTVAMTKSKTMQLLVSDPHLKELMQKDVDQTSKAVEELQQLIVGPTR